MAKHDVIVRLSFWVLPDQMPDFEGAYEKLVVPILKRHGLLALDDHGRPTRDCVFARLFALEAYADVEAKHQALESDVDWLSVMDQLGERFGTGDEVFDAIEISYGSFRMSGIRRSFELYKMPTGKGKTTVAGKGTQTPVTSGRGLWRNYNVTDGLADVDVFAVIQGHDDAMWFGTRAGVCRYDGHTWSRYATQHGLNDDWISLVFEDSRGGLWVGTHEALYYYDLSKNGDFQFELVEKGIGSGYSHHIFEDQKGFVWVLAPLAALWCFDTDQNLVMVKTPQDGLPADVRCCIEDRKGVFWLGTESGRVYTFDGQDFTYWNVDRPMAGAIWVIYEDAQGHIWFGLRSGEIISFDGKTIKTYDQEDGLSHCPVMGICEDSNGQLWFATQGDGIRRFDGYKFWAYRTIDGLTHNIVVDLCSDREGNMWFATVNGVDCFMGASMTSFKHENGLGGNVVFCGSKDRQGHLWFGMENGLTRYDGNTFTTFTQNDGLGGDSVRVLFEDRDGYLWIGTYGGGLTRYDGQVFTTFAAEDGLHSSFAWAIAQDSMGVLWISTWKGRSVVKFDGDMWEHFTSEDGLGDHKFCEVFVDRAGRLWVGSNDGGGLVCVDGQAYTAYADYKGLNFASPRRVFQDSQDVVWVGTKNGVGKFEGTQFSALTMRDGLAHDAIEALFEDRDGYMWFGTTGGGVNRCDFRNGNDAVIQCLDPQDGLVGNKVRVILQDDEGDFWIGTNLGITRYRPDTSTGPDIFVDAVVAGKRFESLDDVSITTSVKLVTFVVRGHSLKTRSEAMIYQYRLRGLHERWRTSYERRIEYENLEAGDYVFEVVAIDRDMMRSEKVATVTLQVTEPPEAALLRVSEAERERLDTELRELQYLYQLRDALSETKLREEAVLRTGSLLTEALSETDLAGVKIELDERVWDFGETENLNIYECMLTWGERDRGVLQVFYNQDLNASQKRAFVDETAGQLSRVLEARELEMQLMQSSRLVSLGEMAAGVAHEFNQPLSVVSTTAGDIYYRLTDGRDLPPTELKEMMQDVLDVVDRLESTVDHLRVFSRDTSQDPGTLFAINDVIDESLKLLGTQFKNHGIALDLNLADDLGDVRGHPRQMEQVVLNLLTNARDAVDARYGQNSANKQIDVRTYGQDHSVIIEVEDNGMGVAEEDVDRLFEPFFTTKPEDRGTGLGLSISYGIVKNHGGEISCECEERNKTLFRVVLPIA